MHLPLHRFGLCTLLLVPVLAACDNGGSTHDLEGRVATLEAQLAALQFSQIQGTVSDAQVPDNVTVTFAATAGDADTLDGYHANEIAESGSFSPMSLVPWWQPVQPFSYLRTGNRVRVTGVLTLVGLEFLPTQVLFEGLPYRLTTFATPTDVVGTAVGALTEFGNPEPTTCTLAAWVGAPGVELFIYPVGFPIRDGGTVSVDFSYDVDP